MRQTTSWTGPVATAARPNGWGSRPGNPPGPPRVEVDSTEQVTRLKEAGLTTFEENDTSCCRALQAKVWVHGPGQEPWEIYAFKADADEMGKAPGSGGRRLVRVSCIAVAWESPGRRPQRRCAQPLSVADRIDRRGATLMHMNISTGEMELVNAGHPAPLLIREGRVLQQLESATPLAEPTGTAPQPGRLSRPRPRPHGAGSSRAVPVRDAARGDPGTSAHPAPLPLSREHSRAITATARSHPIGVALNPAADHELVSPLSPDEWSNVALDPTARVALVHLVENTLRLAPRHLGGSTGACPVPGLPAGGHAVWGVARWPSGAGPAAGTTSAVAGQVAAAAVLRSGRSVSKRRYDVAPRVRSSSLMRWASSSWSSRMTMRQAASMGVPESTSSRARAAMRSW